MKTPVFIDLQSIIGLQPLSLLRVVILQIFFPFCLFGVMSNASLAQTSSLRATQKKQAEAERVELQQKLKALKHDISKTESAKEKASDALEDSEQAISETNRSLRDLQVEQAQAQARLQELTAELTRLTAQVEKQKNQLADFLRRQYMHGDSDRIKLLLSGDNPNRINRELHYMGYVSQTQAKMIEALKVSLHAIEKNTQEAQETKDALDEIAAEEREHKKGLEKEKKRRTILLTDISGKLHAQKKEADSLQKDEQRLSALVSRLNKIMEEQAKAEQAKALAEKQRKEKQALELAQKKALQLKEKKPGKPTKSSNPDAIDDDVNPNTVPSKITKIEQTPMPSANDGVEFSRLKGQLRLPVKGNLIAQFGNKRGDGPSWKGVFIKTGEGAEVKAIAQGKVVFAEWLRGFGNMIILDHGGQYLSLYSNNQAVLKHAGDNVKAGEVIASAGNSGGNEETGLYFEMRHQGRVFDPMPWVKK